MKKRVTNVLLVTFVGFGTFYAFKEYRKWRWVSEIKASNEESGKKPKIVVLGTGQCLQSVNLLVESFHL